MQRACIGIAYGAALAVAGKAAELLERKGQNVKPIVGSAGRPSPTTSRLPTEPLPPPTTSRLPTEPLPHRALEKRATTCLQRAGGRPAPSTRTLHTRRQSARERTTPHEPGRARPSKRREPELGSEVEYSGEALRPDTR